MGDMSKVTVYTANGAHTYTIENEASIGRHPQCTVCVHDPMVSKRHAVIRKVGNDYFYEDLGSSNGSFIDGFRITRHKFKDGDRVDLGKITVEFHAETETERLAKMVNISHISDISQVQDRIEVMPSEEFQPEEDVSDLTVLRGDYEKLRLGNKLLQTIGLERDLNPALEKVTDELLDIFSADRCVIMLVDPISGELVPSAVETRTNGQHPFTVSESVLREVRESKSALLLADAATDDRFSHASSLIMQGIRSVMCAPIMYNGEFLGVVHLDSQKGRSSFTRKDLQLLTSIVRYVAMTVANTRLLKKVESEAKMKAQFERLLSPSVVEQVMSGRVTLEKGGELRDVTILFADIRGFTEISHRSSATSVVAMLNRYFEIIVDVVFKYDGTVDKYIGDEIMVLFGAPVEVDKPADRAVACALEMMGALEQFNLERERNGEEAIQIGVGINSGEVVVGSIGSSQTMQYTCIGDAVNVAARLTGMAGPGQVMVSQMTLDKLKSKADYDVMPPVTLKGIGGELNIYAVKELLTDTKDSIEV